MYGFNLDIGQKLVSVPWESCSLWELEKGEELGDSCLNPEFMEAEVPKEDGPGDDGWALAAPALGNEMAVGHPIRTPGDANRSTFRTTKSLDNPHMVRYILGRSAILTPFQPPSSIQQFGQPRISLKSHPQPDYWGFRVRHLKTNPGCPTYGFAGSSWGLLSSPVSWEQSLSQGFEALGRAT